jgi:serine/threonine protein kinase
MESTAGDEAVDGYGYTSKADIWSFGCLLLEMLTGQHPWGQYDQIQALYRIGLNDSTPWAHYLSRMADSNNDMGGENPVPSDIRRLLESCLENNPRLRPDACQLLQQFTNDNLIDSYPD